GGAEPRTAVPARAESRTTRRPLVHTSHSRAIRYRECAAFTSTPQEAMAASGPRLAVRPRSQERPCARQQLHPSAPARDSRWDLMAVGLTRAPVEDRAAERPPEQPFLARTSRWAVRLRRTV